LSAARPPSAAPERPTWLKPRPPEDASEAPARPPQRRAPSPLPDLPPPPSFWLTHFSDRVRWWWDKSFGWGLGVSTALHLALLGILSLIVLHGSLKPEWGVAAMFGADEQGTELDLPLDTQLDIASAAPLEFTSFAPTDGLEQVLESASDRFLGALDGKQDGDGDGDLGMMGRNVRPPSSAITKGSFTVWTDPVDPTPGKNYDIVIQVDVPKSMTTYRLKDLEGTVRGTDRYFKSIQYTSSERRAVKDGVVQVRVPIPGAAVLVRDTIKIRSKVLDEEQTIEIVF
jgi:hypothetical protein